jgi:hypothetical protein
MKNNILFSILIALIMMHICQSFSSSQINFNYPKQTKSNDTLTFKTFRINSGWGYDIYLNEKLYIHQPSIPAVMGSKCFSKEKYAIKTAQFVIVKIRQHTVPPSVTPSELDSLKVL